MTKIPLLCLTKNRPRMFRAMIESLEQVTDPDTYRLIIVDNASECPTMITYLRELESRYKIIRNIHNFGIAGINHGMDEIDSPFFMVSDPDLKFNKDMPKDWVLKFAEVLSKFPAVNKIGPALNITFNVKNVVTEAIQVWEGRYWGCPMSLAPVIDDVCYSSNIDTTLAMYRTDYYRNKNTGLVRFFQTVCWPAVRVAGRYTAEHLGWDVYREYEDDVRFHSKYCSMSISGTTKFLMENFYGA